MPAAASGQQEFLLLRPQGWQSRSGDLGGGKLRQYTEPQHNALVEVYSYKAGDLTAQRFADLWEQRARQNNVVYVQQRVSSDEVAADSNLAVLRGYQGVNQGHPIKGLILYTIYNGKAYVVVGVWAREGNAGLAATVRRCVTSLRFGDPTKASPTPSPAPASKPSAASPPNDGLRRFTSKAYGYSIAAPAAWAIKRESEPDNVLLMLRPASAKAALVVWAGKVDGITRVEKLAADWEGQAQSSLPALSQRKADCDLANWPHLRQKAQLSCRRYSGVVNGASTASTVLYALRGGVGYVLMASYRPGQAVVERMLRQAMLSFRLTHLGQAASAAPRRDAAQNPNDADAYNKQGNARLRQKDYGGAITAYNKAIALNPNFASAYYNRGIARNALKDYGGAISDYSKAIALRPNFADAYYNRGIARKAQKDYGGAIADYSKAIALNPNDASAYKVRGIARRAQRDLGGAIADYDKAIALRPNYPSAYYNRGNVRLQQKDYDRAFADYNKAIALNPNYAQAYNNRGNVREAQKDYGGAMTDYNKAIALNPNYTDAYYNRGVTRQALKDYGGAVADYNKAIALRPNYAKAYGNRAITLVNLGRMQKALASAQRGVELDPHGRTKNRDILAWVKKKMAGK